ncbi:MAG: MarR family transcriptional regulator [Methanobrevibacter sp.]|jgi:predicted transcriptional regulator|nr:MarR family transcriptional regulator [Candidatus Methanoflexus mossambicus]
MEIIEDFYKDISFLKAGQYRMKVILDINDKIKTPKDISKSAEIPMRETSRALSELKKRDFVIVLDESAKKGRLYKLTNKGKEAFKIIKENF